MYASAGEHLELQKIFTASPFQGPIDLGLLLAIDPRDCHANLVAPYSSLGIWDVFATRYIRRKQSGGCCCQPTPRDTQGLQAPPCSPITADSSARLNHIICPGQRIELFIRLYLQTEVIGDRI